MSCRQPGHLVEQRSQLLGRQGLVKNTIAARLYLGDALGRGVPGEHHAKAMLRNNQL
jgi:hypothetical protein